VFARASFRFAGLAAGLAALAVVGPVAAASDVVNISGSATIAQVEWDYDDDGTFVGGYVVAADDRTFGTIIESFQYSEAFVQCEGANTPDDPTDDRFDFQIVLASGTGYPTTFTIGRSYGGATVIGELTIVVDHFDGCTGESTTEVLTGVPVSLDIVGTGSLVREAGRGSFRIPGELNAHGSFRQTSRTGEGVAGIGSEAFTGVGIVGTVSWREHANGR